MRKIYKGIVVAITVVGIHACDYDDTCRKDKYVRMEAAFYQATYNSTSETTTISSETLKNISVKGIGSDSILYENDTLSSVVLPLKKFENTTRFQITYGKLTDTITVLHTNTDTYISLECGCVKTFVLDSVYSTKHFIDSVKISLKDVNTTTSAKENIKIYN